MYMCMLNVVTCMNISIYVKATKANSALIFLSQSNSLKSLKFDLLKFVAYRFVCISNYILCLYVQLIISYTCMHGVDTWCVHGYV